MSSGKCFVWIIASLLFICLLSGGTLLAIYLIQPESSTSPWYPVVGLVLVCFPWLFWLITFSYRILSRKLGFRMVCWGDDAYPAEGSDTGAGGSLASYDGNATYQGPEEAQSSTQAQGGSSMGETGLGNSPGNNPSAEDSHESEIPLKSSSSS